MIATTTKLLVLLVLSLATPIFLVNCANEQEKPLEQAEEAAGLEEAEQLQPHNPRTTSRRKQGRRHKASMWLW